jgi:hypothetical protein
VPVAVGTAIDAAPVPVIDGATGVSVTVAVGTEMSTPVAMEPVGPTI